MSLRAARLEDADAGEGVDAPVQRLAAASKFGKIFAGGERIGRGFVLFMNVEEE